MKELNVEKVRELIEKKDYVSLKELFDDYNPVDSADIFEKLDKNQKAYLFRLLSRDIAAEIFSYLEPSSQEEIVNAMTDKQVQEIVSDLYTDDAIDFIEEMPSNVVKRVLSQVDSEKRKEINEILNYDENSAGYLMTTEYIELKQNLTCNGALHRIRLQPKEMEVSSTCYVIGSKRELLGSIRLSTIVFSSEDVKIADIMEENIVCVKTKQDKEEIAAIFKKYDINIVPVVNDDNCMMGIITVDDVIDIIDEEATEDIQKMAAVAPLEDTYIKTGVWELAKKRIPWLLLLMISATFTGNIIGNYEHALQKIAILSVFIPMLMDTAGNAGNQAATLVIRGLALGEISSKDFLTILFKELRVSLLAGGILSISNFLFRTIIPVGGATGNVLIVVSLTLLVVVILAKTIGCTLPVIAHVLGKDAALMAGPLVTTIVDALALLVYFFLATQILGI